MATKQNLNEQAQKILEIAAEYGVESNFLFITTFKRYQVQMQILSDLEKVLQEKGATVTKEYVKGRENLYTNPAMKEYNNTANAANKTVGTLIRIINDLRKGDGATAGDDPLLKAIQGMGA